MSLNFHTWGTLACGYIHGAGILNSAHKANKRNAITATEQGMTLQTAMAKDLLLAPNVAGMVFRANRRKVVDMSLSERIRPNIEAAPWVVEEVVKLESQLSAMTKAKEEAESALIPKTLPEGLVPHAYQLEPTMRNADYWYGWGHKETDKGKAVMCMAQAMFAWKNAALAKAEDAMKAEQRAESAEQKLREAQEQGPWIVVGLNNATGRWTELSDSEVGYTGKTEIKLYAAPIPPADVAELERELRITKAHEAAERATNETLAKQIAELTRKLAEQQAINVRLQKMTGSIVNPHEELTNLLEEANRQAVPEGCTVVPIEPTDNGVQGMVNAGAIALKQHEDAPFMENRTGIAKFVWEAMLSAAPKPEGVDK